MSGGLSERAFEDHICSSLVTDGGYTSVKVGTDTEEFDPVLGLDLSDLFGFITDTQAEEWAELCLRHGSENTAKKKFAERLAKQLDRLGTVDVLRHGVTDLGVQVRLAFPKPSHGLTPEVAARYGANRVVVMRQLPYNPASNETIDLGLLVNGIPVATAELKNQLTDQNVSDAVKQYRDRDPKPAVVSRPGMVHFAVDTEKVMMTTRLDSEGTRFLPFNRGCDGGPGNPPNLDGHSTSYLWEQVWARDNWMDLLFRFIHIEKAEGSGPGTVIFPRFHQWDAVRSIEAACLTNGPGENYLVQHSAGSGKSNTIAWLCHRLYSLHQSDDNKVFDKVIVITDRVVLDRQLQDTIYQFEHAHGVVQKIDDNSAQLAEALKGQTAKIIITTLQKFPFVLDKVAELKDRSYAIVVDEAHSSQSGESAKAVRKALGESDIEESGDPVEDALLREATARGRQPNLSYFAFTATPKNRTLELFGRPRDGGLFEAFHLYPMRQAIEEGFILDVLANYTTYDTYFKIQKDIEDDPEFETSQATRALARYVTLHPENQTQKAEIVAKHFCHVVKSKIAGQAKAMVVCSSRLHAIRFFKALRKALRDDGRSDIGVLVAFSGTLTDDDGEWTETKANSFPESQTAERFDTDEYRIMVVAEKFQTGFDQPLLQAMYVDKPLKRQNAVQTLSRLNRIHKGKDECFVLDFFNDAETIEEAFQDYYDRTIAPKSDPNLMYDARHAIDPFGVLDASDIEKVVELIIAKQGDVHKKVHAAIKPTLDRYTGLEDDDPELFRKAMNEYLRLYGYLSQAVSFVDTQMERDFIFLAALKGFLRPETGDSIDVSEKVILTHLRQQKTSEGSIGLGAGQRELPPVDIGSLDVFDPDHDRLSRIIERLNERYGLNLVTGDRLHLEAIISDLIPDEHLQDQAAANTPENFKIVFDEAFKKQAVERLLSNKELTTRLLDDEDFLEAVTAAFQDRAQGQLAVARQERVPIGELLAKGENKWVEYKSTLRTAEDGGQLVPGLETACLKTVAGYLNSFEGGTLLIGVSDDGSVHGLASDFASLHKEGKGDADRFVLHLDQLIINAVGKAAAAMVSIQLHNVDGKNLSRVHVKPSAHPVTATVKLSRQGQMETVEKFYARFNGRTDPIEDPEQLGQYIASRWPNEG